MKGLQTQSGGDVNVEVNATPGTNLMEKLNEMRSEYERLIENNRREVESWYETKVKHEILWVSKSFTKILFAHSRAQATYQVLYKGLLSDFGYGKKWNPCVPRAR